MLRQSLKDIYFMTNRWLVIPNTLLQRVLTSHRRDLIVHLGCGDDYLEGMINVDGNIMRKKDMWLDLRNRLPFRDKSTKLIYCCHMLEHLFPEEAIRLLKEMHRILAEDGIVRLAVPSFERCLRIADGDDEFPWPRTFDDSVSQAINYLFCDGQHKYAYCFHILMSFAEQAGFSRITNYSEDSGTSEKNYDGIIIGNEPPGSLIVELMR